MKTLKEFINEGIFSRLKNKKVEVEKPLSSIVIYYSNNNTVCGKCVKQIKDIVTLSTGLKNSYEGYGILDGEPINDYIFNFDEIDNDTINNWWQRITKSIEKLKSKNSNIVSIDPENDTEKYKRLNISLLDNNEFADFITLTIQ